MTLEEAEKIGILISHADGGCPHCVTSLVAKAEKLFPEFSWNFNKDSCGEYNEEYKIWENDFSFSGDMPEIVFKSAVKIVEK